MSLAELDPPWFATCSPRSSLEAAGRLLLECEVDSLVVLDPDRRVLGIVRETDLQRRLAAAPAARQDPVETVLDRDVAVCHPTEELRHLLALFVLVGTARIPVVDGRGSFVGAACLDRLFALALRSGDPRSLSPAEIVSAFCRIVCGFRAPVSGPAPRTVRARSA